MKVLVAGDFAFQQYEPDFCEGLRSAGAQVIELPVQRYFGPGGLLQRAQQKLVWGPGVAAANAALLAACAREKPDLVLAWRAPWLEPLAMWLARAAGAGKIALYNNDDPFGPDRALRIWRAFRRGIPHADVCFAYRDVNLEEYRAAGARKVSLLRAAWNPRRFKPLPLPVRWDVVFVGHCEDDGRAQALELLVTASPLRVKLFGTGWEKATRSGPLAKLGPVLPARGDEYVRALCSARIALAFLSKRNRDTVTRRCFEIPAAGTLMLAERTPELLELFSQEEAAFFGSSQELLEQAVKLCADEPRRARMAAAGHARLLRDGHDVTSRARALLDQVFPA